MFYFSSKKELKTKRFEFHKNISSNLNDNSFVYMLQELHHVDFKDINDYLEQDSQI